jgi:hypothetical protein
MTERHQNACFWPVQSATCDCVDDRVTPEQVLLACPTARQMQKKYLSIRDGQLIYLLEQDKDPYFHMDSSILNLYLVYKAVVESMCLGKLVDIVFNGRYVSD